MGYLKIICLDECYAYFWVYIYLILFTSCLLVCFLSTAFSRASKQTGLPLTRVKTKWPPPLLWWHKMKCIFPQAEGAKVPVLMEVLVHTKWGAKTSSVGSCVNFCRVKAVQVQRGRVEVSVSWYGGPLEVASKRKPFCCGMGLGRAGSSKAALVSQLQVQGRDVLPPWCHHQALLLTLFLSFLGQ